jgi:hypothetical protein
MERSLLGNVVDEQPISLLSDMMQGAVESMDLDPKMASLPRLLLMGPRRGGKTSIQVSSAYSILMFLDGMKYAL